MSSIFTKIINGEIPCFKIAENALFLAFLDIEPLRMGHVLVVPKKEVDKMYEAEDIYLQNWLLFAQPIARAIEKSISCKRVGISFIGLEVPHAHMHLVPINSANDLNFNQKPEKPSMEELKNIQSLILSNLG
ncbi:MAG: HIT domain-containing protein [Phycisphaerales bacterium]|nr:HIT domain-containing protein [Phycisphaerales bacterium]